MKFKEFKELQQNHFAAMVANGHRLFKVHVSPDDLWELYLDSFPDGTNEVYRERREMDCSCCRSFVRSFGNVVTINADNTITTIWDFDTNDEKYQPVLTALSDYLKAAHVDNVLVTKERAFGTDKSRELLESGVHTWHHFSIVLPPTLIYSGNKTTASEVGKLRDIRNVFQRSLEEISVDALDTVLDLIAEKTLYRGEEWHGALTKFRALHVEYRDLPDDQRDNYAWRKSVEVGGAIGKIRNHSIGVLLNNISDGMDIETAVRKYETIVAPANYQRPKAIFTKRMVEDAENKVNELGLLQSLGRRHAILDDITVNNVLWANRDAQKHMGGLGGVFDALRQDVLVNPADYSKIPVVNIAEFMTDILPQARNLDVLFENRHVSNLVSLIAPQVADSPTLFKWENAFAWAYNGNMADSAMKAQVKSLGGKVDCALRFSISWNDNGDDPNDYDAHCTEPSGFEIFYQRMRNPRTTGNLDVDIVDPYRQVANGLAVENITWINELRIESGEYHCFVHNYSHRGGRSGFAAEIEYQGQIWEYEYRHELAQDERVTVARFKLDSISGIKFIEALSSQLSQRTIWNLSTNQFHPVSVCMYSPNYWDDQKGIGNRHYMFMLADCQNDERPNGFYNEYLREDFRAHRKVFEALGSKMKVDQSNQQLSGLGFSSTKRNSVIVKADDRPVKIVF